MLEDTSTLVARGMGKPRLVGRAGGGPVQGIWAARAGRGQRSTISTDRCPGGGICRRRCPHPRFLWSVSDSESALQRSRCCRTRGWPWCAVTRSNERGGPEHEYGTAVDLAQASAWPCIEGEVNSWVVRDFSHSGSYRHSGSALTKPPDWQPRQDQDSSQTHSRDKREQRGVPCVKAQYLVSGDVTGYCRQQRLGWGAGGL